MEALAQPRVVRCEEWEPLKIGAADAALSFEEVGQIFRRWRAQTGTSPESYFDQRGNTIAPKNWSGVASGDSVQLEVRPMGASRLDAQELETLDRNISLMLQATLMGGSMELAEGGLAQFGQRLQALLAAFCTQLIKARRKRIIRQYKPIRTATRCIRGRTVFPDQVFESIRRPGSFASEWVALDEDTPENRFIKAVLTQFRPRSFGHLRYTLDELLCQFDRVSLPASPRQEWRHIRFDKLSRGYVNLPQLGRSLLGGQAPSLFSGITRTTTEIVFTARAFEVLALRSPVLLNRGVTWLSGSAGGSILEGGKAELITVAASLN